MALPYPPRCPASCHVERGGQVVTRRGLEPRTPCLKDPSRKNRKLALDKDFQHLAFMEGWTKSARLDILTSNLTTGGQQEIAS